MKECIECPELIKEEAKYCNFCSTKQPPRVILPTDPDSDPRNMCEIEARWRPVLDRAGVQTIGERIIPSRPIRIKAASDWIAYPLKDNEVCDIPPKTNERIQAVEREGLVIDCWILMDEQPPPLLGPDRDYDPLLIGVINTSKYRGVWCVFGRWVH